MGSVPRLATILVLSAVALFLIPARPHGQAPALTVTPANATILVGETRQFAASGALTPVAIAAGGYHTCLLLNEQTVRCAGLNNWGQLGNGTFASSSTPVAASGLTGAIGIGNGIEHTCAFIADGTMQCWGTNYTGQLGDGTIGGYSLVPKPVQGLTNVIAPVVGGFHTCAVMSDHTARCWGRNQDGQIGNGDSTTDVTLPQAVANLGTVAALTAGGYHTCALMPNASVRCWGRNTRGQLGDGTSTSSTTPVAVSGMTNAVAVSGGFYHTCALLADGTVQCWGENDSGQIGNTLIYSSVPLTVSGITNAVAVSAGAYHSCALLADGTSRCWGRNGNGQLGDGTTANSPSPVTVSGLINPSTIVAGGLHTCAFMPDHSARCWGWNDYGQVGNGSTASVAPQSTVVGTGLTWTSSNPAAATINAAGRATAVGNGVTTIGVTDGFGNSASTTLTVGGMHTLTVIRTGSGSGSVSSNPAGVACGSDCSEAYASGTSVSLTATPAAGSVLAGWTGCDSVSGSTCAVTMSAARSVTASFAQVVYPLTVSKAGAGTGTISSSPAGITCGSDCTESYVDGTPVTLTAAPAAGSVLSGWTGCATVSGSTCTVTMSAARSVTATFVQVVYPLTVSKAGAGTGTISSSPAGITCGNDCTESYVDGTPVTLTAAPAAGSVLTGWTGCATVSGLTCTVTMSAARSVTATFARVFTLTVDKAGIGSGTITSAPAGINCGGTCSAPYVGGTAVTLTATPALGSLFLGWSGCDSTSGSSCTVTMGANRSVTATFLGLPLD